MPTLRFPSSFPPSLLHNLPDFRPSQHQSTALIFSPKPFYPFPKKFDNEVSTRIHCPQLSKSWKWRDRISFISSFFDKSREIETLKQDLLEAIAPLDRGAAATPEDQQRIELVGRRVLVFADKIECVDFVPNLCWNYFLFNKNKMFNLK